MAEMEISFDSQVLAARQRLRGLNQRAQMTNAHDLMPYILEELALLLHLLQQAESVIQSSEQHRLTRAETLDAEAQRYRDMFEHAPVPYFVTSLDGTLQRLNQEAAALFDTAARQLIGRSLALFIPEGERRAFRARLTTMAQATEPVNATVMFQSWSDRKHVVQMRVSALRGPSGRPTALAWVAFRQPAARERAEERVAAIAQP